jgi:hypothetical protein
MNTIQYKKRQKKDDIIFKLNVDNHKLNKEVLELTLEEKSKKPVKYLRCSFCGKDEKEVKKMLAGPDAFICDECIEECGSVIENLKKNEQDSI